MSMQRYALFLDFDGTLVDIVPTPDAVVVSDELRETLCALRERFDGALALVSGRRIDNIDKDRTPIFFGDDATDEDGIRIVNSRGGLSVNVGARSSAAMFRKPDPHYVRARLRGWAQVLPEDFTADLRGAD
jgi:trehalose-6-phosphatase